MIRKRRQTRVHGPRCMRLILRQRTRSITICMIDIASKDAEYNDMHEIDIASKDAEYEKGAVHFR
jgi:hypothetical protein